MFKKTKKSSFLNIVLHKRDTWQSRFQVWAKDLETSPTIALSQSGDPDRIRTCDLKIHTTTAFTAISYRNVCGLDFLFTMPTLLV